MAKYIAYGNYTDNVVPDEYERKKKFREITEKTTAGEILQWAMDYGLDEETIRIARIQEPPTTNNK